MSPSLNPHLCSDGTWRGVITEICQNCTNLQVSPLAAGGWGPLYMAFAVNDYFQKEDIIFRLKYQVGDESGIKNKSSPTPRNSP